MDGFMYASFDVLSNQGPPVVQPVRFLGPSESRVCLTVATANSGQDLWIAPVKMTNTNQGFLMSQHSGQFVFTRENSGTVLGNAWWLWAATNFDSLAWIEVLKG